MGSPWQPSETQQLATELESAAFVRTEPAIFTCLGVIFYLTPSAARATLEYIAGQAQPVEIIFDYLQPASSEGDRTHLQARAERLAGAGEPFVTYSAPGDIARLLRTLGFATIDDCAAHDVISAHLGESAESAEEPAHALRASRIMRASRGRRPPSC